MLTLNRSSFKSRLGVKYFQRYLNANTYKFFKCECKCVYFRQIQKLFKSIYCQKTYLPSGAIHIFQSVSDLEKKIGKKESSKVSYFQLTGQSAISYWHDLVLSSAAVVIVNNFSSRFFSETIASNTSKLYIHFLIQGSIKIPHCMLI